MGKDIWVVVEHYDNEIEEATFEILEEARRLADSAGVKVSAVLLGYGVASLCDALSRYGADHIYLADHHLLEDYTTDGYTLVLAELVRQYDPCLLLLAGTFQGRDLAPRLATRLKTGLVSDCMAIRANDQGILEMTRPTYGGRVYATITCPSAQPQIATLRPGVIGTVTPKSDRIVSVERVDVDLNPEAIRTKILGYSKVNPEVLDISEAESVVAVGHGLGDGAKRPMLEELAKMLGASLAGSRLAVDEGWLSFDRQIGQTGKSVSPKLIICCGISGASPFTMGIMDSKLIVAINNDRRAPIFQVADVSVLGDLHKVVPALIEYLKGWKDLYEKK